MRLLCPLLVVTLLAAPAGAQDADLASRARSFTETFLSTDLEGWESYLDETMANAMPAAKAAALRDQLIAQQGSVQKILEPWPENEAQGYRRYRVPVRFERATIDFRLVFDSEDRIAGMFVVPHVERPDPDARPPAGTETEITVGRGDRSLPGSLLLPPGDGPFPAVILVHGSGPNDRDETLGPNKPFRDIAWGLAERGVATLRYDKRTYADPGSLAGLADSLTLVEETIDDAVAAVQTARSQKGIDAARVWVLGHSLGGTAAPRIGAATEPPPAGLIVLAGAATPIPEMISRQLSYIADSGEGTQTPEQLEAIKAELSKLRSALDGEIDPPGQQIFNAPFSYWADLDAHDPPQEAAALDLPVLVLQGERDYQVTMEDFGRWREALAERDDACLRSYPELDHLFLPGEGPSRPSDYQQARTVDARVIDQIAAWIRDRACQS